MSRNPHNGFQYVAASKAFRIEKPSLRKPAAEQYVLVAKLCLCEVALVDAAHPPHTRPDIWVACHSSAKTSSRIVRFGSECMLSFARDGSLLAFFVTGVD